MASLTSATCPLQLTVVTCLFNVSETKRQRIQDIDVALEQIEKGEYGICMSCGEEISPRRMEVRPFSRYCIECKTDIEKFGE